ncbi:MAG: hypothetical protein HOF43_04735 [Chloroflexi bacterium]|nr:hypothetical protein [Chloroflexota bacterium]
MIDFAPHKQRVLIEEHAHHRLGLADEELAAWCENADLKSSLAQELKGDPLTVNIWLASRESSNLTSSNSERASTVAAN